VILVIANTLELEWLVVEEKSLVGIKLERAEAAGRVTSSDAFPSIETTVRTEYSAGSSTDQSFGDETGIESLATASFNAATVAEVFACATSFHLDQATSRQLRRWRGRLEFSIVASTGTVHAPFVPRTGFA